MAGENYSYSIGQNVSKDNVLSYGSSSNTVGSSGGSIWQSIFSDTLPALFQSGAGLLANNRNAQAQETISQNQGIMSWFNYGATPGAVTTRPNNSWMWIVLVLVAVVVMFFVFKKK